MSEDLKPQTPGELPDVDQDRIATIAGGNVDDVLQAIDGLSLLDLQQLVAVERQGKDRKTVLGAIEREIERRENNQPREPVEVLPARKLGAADFRQTPAAEIDRSKLTRAVLAKEGWVLPLPKAEA